MKDPEGVLERKGPKTRHPDMIRFKTNEEVARMVTVIRAYLSEAKGYAEAGVRAPKEVHDLDLPAELVAAMDADPELAEAFDALTPGRKNSYVINLSGAKTAATRMARIAKFRDRILAGKGATER